MPTKSKSLSNANIWRVAFFLAYRQIKRASLWTTLLIIAVMTLTFLNLVVVNGVLVGLIQSSVEAQRERGTGDVLVSRLQQKNQVERSQEILSVLNSLSDVTVASPRYTASGNLNADYRRKLRQDETPNAVGASFVGVDPIIEDKVTGISKYIVEGAYLQDNDVDGIIVGANFLYKYTPIETAGFQTLKDISIGQKLKLTINGNSKEVIVRGVIKSKVDDNDFRVFMLGTELRKLIGRTDVNVDEIAVKLLPGADEDDAVRIKQLLLNNGFDESAKIQTFVEAQPKFLKDIAATFGLLGNMIGSIGLAVASITIFIVIFVNAITRRKFIGILKGIGVHPKAIEVSYIMQSIFYAVTGSVIGLALLYGFLVPFIDAHPINFPFSDGILYAPYFGTFIRVLLLLITTIIAGYIPARMIVKKNTLDAILGR
ncbi:MAG: FtsX-like permease family protein [Candidatus Pacebacteria bacterium]|nr:FtsX-like permease family protein [Candidatus Paceibacterota bacterium]MBP9818836.1 FtsX-like permease family protein [Candidatus Paceibacterota bacterium]